MERIASKLHELGEELGLVFSENRGWRAQRRIGETEPVLSLYRYNHDSLMDDISPLPSERNSESGYHALTLHLPIQHCEFRIQSHQGPLSFHASPGSIVATIGEQLEVNSNIIFYLSPYWQLGSSFKTCPSPFQWVDATELISIWNNRSGAKESSNLFLANSFLTQSSMDAKPLSL